MSSFVVATAGHVDHGKSALVRALTGIEPDRLAEERRRGLTVDLGFAWTTLVPGTEVAFVDVPGHERFLGNMLAGLGPTPVVCFVVAADEGWQAQSSDHRDALAALGITRGVLVLSRADRADAARVQEVIGQARTELAGVLDAAPVVVTSAVTGAGLTELREVLAGVLAELPEADAQARVRLWLDRSFTIAGAGTVVTGTLAAGTIRTGDRLIAVGAGDPLAVTVRGLQSQEEDLVAVGPTHRVAVNVRGLEPGQVGRGDALLTPQAWPATVAVDVRRGSGEPFGTSLVEVNVHVGTAALVGRLRPFDGEHARITFPHPLPVVLGDRIVLRSPGSRRVRAGVVVLDADPPSLARRGDGRRRAAVLATMSTSGDVRAEVARRGALPAARLAELGLIRAGGQPPPEVTVVGEWWVDPAALVRWQQALGEQVDRVHRSDPLAAGLSRGAAIDALRLPSADLLDAVAAAAGLARRGGHLARPGHHQDLGPAEQAVAELETRLRTDPFRAPEAADLVALGLGSRELAAAERAGRLLRLTSEVVLLPDAPVRAMRELAALPQPFTASAAKESLGTTRRVAIPLLEHLDSRGWTRRVDANRREVVRQHC